MRRRHFGHTSLGLSVTSTGRCRLGRRPQQLDAEAGNDAAAADDDDACLACFGFADGDYDDVGLLRAGEIYAGGSGGTGMRMWKAVSSNISIVPGDRRCFAAAMAGEGGALDHTRPSIYSAGGQLLLRCVGKSEFTNHWNLFRITINQRTTNPLRCALLNLSNWIKRL